MKVTVLSYSSYIKSYLGTRKLHNTLVGTQTIYSSCIQGALIETFLSDDQNFTFFINNVILHPTICTDYIEENVIYVSDDVYQQYFKKDALFVLKFFYNVIKAKRLTLKRERGNFPFDDSLEVLLTSYLESCMVINVGQMFNIRYGKEPGEFIVFSIVDVILEKELTRDIEDRLDEINRSVKFNTSYLKREKEVPLGECESFVHHFEWYFHTLGKQKKLGADISYQEVEIDFEEQEQPTIVKTDAAESVKTDVIEPPIQQELTKEELRNKRLEFFSKK